MGRITTNNVPRLLLDANQLTDKERKDLDYLDWDKLDSGEESGDFFRYRGQIYSLDQFVCTDPNGELKDWHGIAVDSFSTGTLVRYCDDTDYVVVGYYCA